MNPVLRWGLALPALFLVVAAATAIHAAEKPAALEPWADARLKVTGGIVVWFDAERLSDGRKALGLPEVGEGDPVDLWPDASGNKRHVIQQKAEAKPRYSPTGDFRAVRFDGKGTHLRLSGAGKSFESLSVFVVAAPYSCAEFFSAFVSMSAAGRNDFESGLNLDQGVGNPQKFDLVNAEGTGFGGMQNLSRESFPYGTVARLGLTSATGENGTTLWINGKRQASRNRAANSVIRVEELVLGGRYYTLGGPPEVRGFLEGDVAEVLVFDRALSNEDRASVESYLAAKYGTVGPLPIPGVSGSHSLVRVADPPPVQVFVPGFSVRSLPVDLPNINNVLYRADGKLVALAYDGNIWILSDTDGDGVEDHAALFWDNQGRLRAPIGMALTPANYRHGTGVFVACKGKVALVVDTDRDDIADNEIVLAEGWKELPHGVDALGVALARDGSVYFGLGCTDYTNAYLVDPQGAPHYSPKDERGSILRVAPDFKSREIVATGIRFPVGLRFNKDDDLFATDQEGATWLPDGNPLDELLHINPRRHYGFPPRHARYLPDVIDEPSVFDYGPQHQSTCGLNFNEPVNGGPVFGPAWWKSNALVAGYSRGKIYRTELVKTQAGYVACSQLFACLNLLTCDVCVSPAGRLVVACHSGGPDWGSGPRGKGKLYQISYSEKELPQPVVVWAQSPREVRVAFDRPLAPEHLSGVAKATIEYGRYVAAGDRFESLWPGYKTVQDQFRAPRFLLPVHSVQVTPDRRTLILATALHPEPAGYALALPGLGRSANRDETNGELRQAAETDMRYDLCGVEASWRAKSGDDRISGWLPHVDLAVARAFTGQSADHNALWERSVKPGELTLRTLLNLKHMLHPVSQPGSTSEYDSLVEQVALAFRSSAPFTIKAGGSTAVAQRGREGFSASISLEGGERVPIEIILPTGQAQPELNVTWSTTEDARPRALPLHRMLLPWVPAERSAEPAIATEDLPELTGGNWARGRKVFFGEQAGCSKCHAVRGEGETIGPDLSNLPQRDYHSVLRDITEPSFSINPDYVTQVIARRDGRVLTGTIRTEGDRLLVADTNGKVEVVRRDEIEEMVPSPVSTMPQELTKSLGPERMRDLLTFLLAEPPRMPDYGRGKPPEPRTRQEVDSILAGAPNPPAPVRPIHVVLVAGNKDHGPGEHDYPAWLKVWEKLFGRASDLEVTTAMDWPSPDDLKSGDVFVFYQQGKWTPERARDIDAFLARGGGLVYIHYAVDGGADAPGFAQRIGLAWQGGKSLFRHGPLDLGFEPAGDHPIARNLRNVHFHDESYWGLVGDSRRINLLGTGKEQGADQPLFWTMESGKGRVFVSIPGHFAWTFDDPVFRVLLLRGIAWTAREPVDRFNNLVLPGARVEESLPGERGASAP